MSTFAERRTALAQKGITTWEPLYDPDAKGVWDRGRTRHTTRESIWLALCYFINGQNVSQANDLVEGVLAQQITTDHNTSRLYNFKWYYEEKGVNDYNGLSFIGPVIAYIYRNHRHQLRSPLTHSMSEALSKGKLCIHALFRDQIPVTYTNVYINQIAYLVMTDSEDEAGPYIDKLYEMMIRGGISEYSSWAYLAVQINGFQAAYVYATNPIIKARLENLLRFHWYDCLHHYHKETGMLSSVAARAKDNYGLIPSYDVQTLMYLYFDGVDLATLSGPSVEALMTNYEPDSELEALFHQKGTIEYQAAYTRVDVTVYQTPDYSLSTQSGRRTQFGYTDLLNRNYVVGHETEEHDIQLVYRNGEQIYRGARFHTYDVDYQADDFNHHWVTSVQKKNKAVVSYHFDPAGITDKLICSGVCLGMVETTLAPEGDYSNFRLNGVTWDGQETALTLEDVIAFKAGNAYIGIRFLHSDVIGVQDHPLCSTERPVSLIVEKTSGPTHRVQLKNYLAHFADPYAFIESGKRLGYVIEMASTSDYPSISAFNEHIQSILITQNLFGSQHHISVISGDDTLELRENLDKNMPVSRKVNGVEFNNHYLLRSRYVSLEVGEDFADMQTDAHGTLPYPPPAPGASRPVSIELDARTMILEQPMTSALHQQEDVIFTTETEKGSAGAIVDIPFNGQWFVWGRVFWESTQANSFFIRFNNDNAYRNRILSDSQYQVFHWVKLPDSFFLSRGRHTLRIDGREANSRLHRIIITNDPSLRPQ